MATAILKQVHEGTLPFDRTMRISTAETNAKDKIATRIPVNLQTLEKLLALNRADWELSRPGPSAPGRGSSVRPSAERIATVGAARWPR